MSAVTSHEYTRSSWDNASGREFVLMLSHQLSIHVRELHVSCLSSVVCLNHRHVLCHSSVYWSFHSFYREESMRQTFSNSSMIGSQSILLHLSFHSRSGLHALSDFVDLYNGIDFYRINCFYLLLTPL